MTQVKFLAGAISMNEFKVLTLNIHKGFSVGNRRFTLEKIRQNLRASNCNIIFLQEVVGENERHRNKISDWPDQNQFEFLADSVWDHYAYGKNAIYQHGHHGNAILSELPFLSWNNINISMMSFSQRGILHGQLENNVHVLCAHLGLFERERMKQTDKLMQYIDTKIPSDAALILAGDFNDWRKSVHNRLCNTLGLSEAYEQQHKVLAKTYPTLLPCLAMDRIYFRGFQMLGADIKTGSAWGRVSDHCAMTAELHLLDCVKQLGLGASE